jgi:hypothetical protein
VRVGGCVGSHETVLRTCWGCLGVIRLLAVAEIAFPEGSKPEYGSDDASKTVYDGNEDVRSKMMVRILCSFGCMSGLRSCISVDLGCRTESGFQFELGASSSGRHLSHRSFVAHCV